MGFEYRVECEHLFVAVENGKGLLEGYVGAERGEGFHGRGCVKNKLMSAIAVL